MKFSKVISGLLGITSVLAILNVEKCTSSLEEYQECLLDYQSICSDENKIQQSCSVYQSKKCQNFIMRPKRFLNTCNFEEIEFLKDIDSKINIYNYLCEKKVADDTICRRYKFENLNNEIESLRNELNNIDTISHNELISKISNLEREIFEGIKKYKKDKNPNDQYHYKEVVQLVELLNNNNKLVVDFIGVLDINDISALYSKVDPIYIYNDNGLTNKIKYILADNYIKVLTDILEHNKENFGIGKNTDVKSLISNRIKDSDKNLKFSQGYELPEINIEILNKIFNKNYISENEVIDYIINHVFDYNQLSDLKECYELKRKLIEHEAPTSRNENEINIMNDISKKLNLNNNKVQLKTFQNTIYDSFVNFLEATSQFDDYVKFENLKNDENGNLDISDIYINYKGKKVIENDIKNLFNKLDYFVTAMIKDERLGRISSEEFNLNKGYIEVSISKLTNFITMYVNELAKSIDKENDETFSNAFTYLRNIVDASDSFITTASDLCHKEELKNSISESMDKLNELKTLNNKYKKETKYISVKPITISVPNRTIDTISSDNFDDETNLDIKILKSLKYLRIYDPKNIKVKGNDTKIQSPQSLYEKATTLSHVIEKSLGSYKKNINDIDNSANSREILINLYDAINILASRYVKSEYLEDINISDVNKEKIRKLSILLDENVTIHNTKFNEKLLDNNGNEIKSTSDYKSKAETNSKYVIDMMHTIYDKLFIIFDLMDGDEFNSGTRDNMEKSKNGGVYKVYNDNRKSELKYFRKKLKEYEIDENDKDYQKDLFLNIYKDIAEVEEVFDRENKNIVKNNGNKFANNSNAVYSLSNLVYNILISNFDDKEVKNLRNNYHSEIGGIDKSKIESDNVLNLDYLVKNIDPNYFIHDSNYKMYVKSYFTYLKHRLLDTLENEDEFEKIMNKLKTIRDSIKEKINIFCKYNSSEDRYEEADHLMELSNSLNDFIDFCIDYNIEIEDFQKIDLNTYDELSNRLNYIRVKLMIDTFDEIAKSHPKIFKIRDNKSLSDYIEPAGGSSYYSFDGYIRDPVERDLQNIIKKIVNSKYDAIITFVDNVSNEYQVLQLEQSFGMDYKFLIQESSFYRDKNEVDDMNKLLKNKHFVHHLRNKCIKRLETYDQTIERLKKRMVTTAKLTGIDVDSTDSETIIYSVQEKALSTNDKKIRNKLVKQLNHYVDFLKNEVIKVSGKVSSDVFNTIYDHSLTYNKISMNAIKAIESNTSGGSNNNSINNKFKNAMNFNAKNINNIDPNKLLPIHSSIIKGTSNNNIGHHSSYTPPNSNHNNFGNIHKIGGKYKRNINYIKALY